MSIRAATFVRIVSIVVILASVIIAVRSLPMETGIERLKVAVEEAGATGMLYFGVAYVVGALMFVPGGAISLAGGAIFGISKGFLVVSTAATIAAACAFVIARYIARSRVEEMLAGHPKFRAVDCAIGEKGWKIVAMLRLSPAVPYSASNYLYGLTAIRFVPYLLATWIFMMPGVFLYMYLGNAIHEGVLSASGADRAKTPGEWALFAAGLAATIAVTVYVTKLARRALKEADLGEAADPSAIETRKTAPAFGFRNLILPAVSIAVLAGALWACSNRDGLEGLFGPPLRTAHEKHEAEGTAFDHALFDGVLHRHVRDGRVDYATMKSDASLDTYIESLANVSFNELSRDEKLAMLINAYNAFTLKHIVENIDLPGFEGIKDGRLDGKRWKLSRWNLGGKSLSLDAIENDEIRPNFVEPRIHWALVCAAVGCPPLRNEAYDGKRIDEQLEAQASFVHSHERWYAYDGEGDVVRLNKLYDWYGGDFRQASRTVLDHAARHDARLKDRLSKDGRPEIEWIDYDWSLNISTESK